MFLNGQRWMTRTGEQRVRGSFLMLIHPERQGWPLFAYRDYPMRGLVRHVKLSQCGHFMSGRIEVAGHRVYLEGTYGNNGLTREVDPAVYAHGVNVPPELVAAWNKGGGHNSAGSEAPSMLEWAKSIAWRKVRPSLPVCGSCVLSGGDCLPCARLHGS